MSETNKELENETALLEEQRRLEELEELEEQKYLKSMIEATNSKTISYDFSIKTTKKTIPKVSKVSKNKNILSLGEFTKKIDEEVKISQPKKFVSKRADVKRKELGLDIEVIKRTFNARKPPYNFINRPNNINIEVNINNNKEFPSL
jgi:hypothetical protein